jgi:hypothetical protein
MVATHPANGADLQAMATGELTFVFDYVDPGSYVVERALRERRERGDLPTVRRIPLELSPPPADLLDPAEGDWALCWRAMGEVLAEDLPRPTLVPWSRKAHELRLLAAEKGLEEEVHEALFDQFFRKGLDLGRVDLLVAIGVEAGLDQTETRAVLDVDRLTADVTGAADTARALGAEAPPLLGWNEITMTRWTDREFLADFLDEVCGTSL